MSKLITILGPTASGKTALAIKLAKQFSGEIICADSRTIYKDMNIGTAKPTIAEQKEVPHHLLDVVKPGEQFSVSRFKDLALDTVEEIRDRGNIPFIVGGSGLYIDAVLFDYTFRNEDNTKLEVNQSLSLAQLQNRVETQFPEIELNNSDYNNPRRLERILALGIPKNQDRSTLKIDSLVLGMSIKTPILKQNIHKRTVFMLNNNLVQEVENIQRKYGSDCEQLQTIGYASCVKYLANKLTKSELELEIERETYQLARKQLTWFKRNPNIIWTNSYDKAYKKVSDYLGL